MDIKTAFDKLGLPISASEEEIKIRYRDLAISFHPDKGGANSIMSDLSSARDIALEYINKKAIIPINYIGEIIKANTEALRIFQERKETARKTIDRVIRINRSKYKRFKGTAALFGAVSTGIALISSKILPVLGSAIQNNPTITMVSLICAGLSGVYYFAFSYMADNLQRAVEDVNDTLDDKATFYELIMDILGESYIAISWTKKELENQIDKWEEPKEEKKVAAMPSPFPFFFSGANIKSVARRIGFGDFSKLLISKGLDQGIIIEEEIFDEGRFSIKYRFAKNKS